MDTLMAMIFAAIEYKAKTNVCGAKSWGNQVWISQSLLLVESYRLCLISPVMNCDNVSEMMSTREFHSDLG